MDDYADVSLPLVRPTLGTVPGLTESNGQLSLPLLGPPRSDYALHYTSPRAGTVWTDILGGPYLVNVAGGRAVGRTNANWMVVSLPASTTARRLAFSEAHPWPIKLGIAGSVTAALGLVVALVWLGVRRRLLRRTAAPGSAVRLVR
jgi:hypothetical protein